MGSARCPLPVALPLNTTLPFFLSPLLPNSSLPPAPNRFSDHFVNVSIMFFSFENPESRSFETGFPPWYDPESPVVFQEEKSEVSNAWPSHEPVRSNSGSYVTNNISSGSVANERKRRRMISNRESARRSRMRKQNHMEDLKKQQTRLRMVNRESLNRLMLTVHQNRLIRSENERLQSEAAILRRRLWDLRQVLVVRQHSNPPSAWPCNDVTTINGQSPHYSLIT